MNSMNTPLSPSLWMPERRTRRQMRGAIETRNSLWSALIPLVLMKSGSRQQKTPDAAGPCADRCVLGPLK